MRKYAIHTIYVPGAKIELIERITRDAAKQNIPLNSFMIEIIEAGYKVVSKH